jgi:deoxyribonuclease V
MNIKNHQNQPFKRLEIAQQIPVYPAGTFVGDLTFWSDKPFDGLSTDPNTGEILGFFKGVLCFSILPYGKMQAISFYSFSQLENGYIFNGTQLQTNNFGLDRMSENTNENEYWNIHDASTRTENDLMATEYQRWLGDRAHRNQQDKCLHEDGRDYFEIYERQAQWQAQLIATDTLSTSIRYVVAIDVGYDLLNWRITASLVLYDLKTKHIVLTKTNQSNIQLPHYCNDLFPHTDLEVVQPLFEGLTIRPDLVVCNAQGLAHPRRLGLACYIGIAFGLPTFGCTRDRVVGGYEPKDLNPQVGSIQSLKWAGQVGVGNALRISRGKLPVFVSAGHQMTLESATHWAQKLKKVKIEGTHSTDRQLPLLQKAEQLVNQQLEERTQLLFLETV